MDGEIDEIDIAAGKTMVDYLLSLLSEKKPESLRRRMRRIRKEDEEMRKEDEEMNGEDTKCTEPSEVEVCTNGPDSQDVDMEIDSVDRNMENNMNIHENGLNVDRTQSDKVLISNSETYIQENGCDHCNLEHVDTAQKPDDENMKLNENDEVIEENPNISELIKMSYDITVPYNTCSVLGEDLLRGFLQDLDFDCIITVSDVHFRAHR